MYLSKWYQLIFRHVTSFHRLNFILENVPRNFSSFSNKKKENYYEVLGITKQATQSDVKAAYYKLSMQYHPDKNKDSEVAVQKFRDISEAYEVLGNFKLRKLYDKGIIHTAGSQYGQVYRDEVEDDPQTKFYKSRMTKSNVPPATGRTPIYDFDEWSRAHYGTSFARKQTAKANYEKRKSMEKNYIIVSQKELLLFCIAGFIVMLVSFAVSRKNLDVDETKNKQKR